MRSSFEKLVSLQGRPHEDQSVKGATPSDDFLSDVPSRGASVGDAGGYRRNGSRSSAPPVTEVPSLGIRWKEWRHARTPSVPRKRG